MWASTMGLRGNATAIAVPSPMRDVLVDATARGRNGSCRVSADQIAPKPISSALRASPDTARRSSVIRPMSSFMVRYPGKSWHYGADLKALLEAAACP
jgi:hypothetical protein